MGWVLRKASIPLSGQRKNYLLLISSIHHSSASSHSQTIFQLSTSWLFLGLDCPHHSQHPEQPQDTFSPMEIWNQQGMLHRLCLQEVMERWVNGWVCGQVDWRCGWMNRRIDGRVNEQMDAQTDG